MKWKELEIEQAKDLDYKIRTGEAAMKKCAVCHTDLYSSLDEFGPINLLVCLKHFWEVQTAATEYKELDLEIGDIEAQIDSLQSERDDLVDQQEQLMYKFIKTPVCNAQLILNIGVKA